MKTLIKNVCIVTMNDHEEVIENGYIIIDGNKIKKVCSGEFKGDIKDAKVIDGKGYCAMPGLVNSHTHAAMTLLRGYGEGLPLMRWLDRKSTRLNSSHANISYAVFCLK